MLSSADDNGLAQMYVDMRDGKEMVKQRIDVTSSPLSLLTNRDSSSLPRALVFSHQHRTSIATTRNGRLERWQK